MDDVGLLGGAAGAAGSVFYCNWGMVMCEDTKPPEPPVVDRSAFMRLVNALCPDEWDRIHGQPVYTNQNSADHYWPERKS